MVYKTFKSKVEDLEEAVFKSRAVKHTAQFTKTLKEITKYVQKKYNSDMAKMIKDVECPKFDFPAHPVPKIVVNPDRTMTQEKLTRWIPTSGKRTMNSFIVERLISPRKKKGYSQLY